MTSENSELRCKSVKVFPDATSKSFLSRNIFELSILVFKCLRVRGGEGVGKIEKLGQWTVELGRLGKNELHELRRVQSL